MHLDQVRGAPAVYQKPERFFERTFLTENLTSLAAEVLRRLSGEKAEASRVFNVTTQFGGGKTHALTLLYHLAHNGPVASGWFGVSKLSDRAGLSAVPKSDVVVFVGTEFDSISGRGGSDGTPLRRTPWGEVEPCLIKIKEPRGNSSYRRSWRQASGRQNHGDRRSGQMAESKGSNLAGNPNPDPERIPFMQRLLDNPFLLLFLGVTIPTVFYILWGVMELTQVPVAR